MTKKMEELILEKLFKINEELKSCVKKDDLKNFATKDDLKNFATKDDLKAMEERMDAKYATKDDLNAMEERMDAKYATKDDLKAMEQRMYAKMDARFAKQTKDIAEELTMIFESAGRIHDNIEARVNKRTDQKIEQALQY